MTDTPTRAELLVAAALLHAPTSSPSFLDNSAREIAEEPHAFEPELRRARALIGDGWRPIATAPKDGTTIQLWSEYMSEPCTGAWGTQSHGRLGWNAQHDGMPVVESEHALTGTTYKEIPVATHWRPHPAPPSANADKEPAQ